MDAFFASVEVLDNPQLAGKPLVVGGSSDAHGVVAAASYEARAYGIRSAMPMARALTLCPGCIRVGARHGRYTEVSRRVFAILGRFTSCIEPVSVDEAYLDVAGSTRLFGDVPTIARSIKEAVRSELGLTCSVGVATNRLVAKIASDLHKPDGLVIVEPGREAETLAPLAVEKLPGVGPKTAESLHAMGVHVLGRLAAYPAAALAERFGTQGPELARRAAGCASSVVGSSEGAKSISAETTLEHFLSSLDDVDWILLGLCDDVAARARRSGLQARRITIKIRDDQFTTKTRARTLDDATDMAREVAEIARALYRASPVGEGRAVRLLGVALSDFRPAESEQMELFVDHERERKRQAERVVDQIRSELGRDVLKRGRMLEEGD
jgi:DNA polymerase-4